MTPAVMPSIDIGSIHHQLAGPEEDPAIRALLREERFGTGYQLAMEREPCAIRPDFAGGQDHQVLISKDRASGEVVAMGEWTVRQHFIHGQAEPVTYLSGLRLAAQRRGAVSALRGGFQAWKHFAREAPPFAFTAIASDNPAALRLLTRGLPGFPVYRFCCDYLTLALRPRHGKTSSQIESAKDSDVTEIAALLHRDGKTRAFAPAWTETALRDLADHGLKASDFLIRRESRRITGCVALWDQRGFRQTRLCAYPRWIRHARPFLNAMGGLARLPVLPPEGHVLDQAFLSHLASENGQSADLIAAALDQAAVRGLSAALLGLPERDTRVKAVQRRFSGLAYRSKIFLVHWPEAKAAVDALRLETPHFELALL